MIDWDKTFREAHLNSWPHPSLCIQNAKPKDGRNIFDDDKQEILKAAKKYDYIQVTEDSKAKSISFVKKWRNEAPPHP